MFARLSTLDAFFAPRLVRPFYLIGGLVALLWGMVGLLLGLMLLLQMPWLGLLVMVFALATAVLLFLAVRLLAESVTAVFRMHGRFVGGGPNDPIPE